MRRFALPLAFWLAKPYILGEIIDELLSVDQASTVELQNALTCLIELGAPRYAQIKLNQSKEIYQRLDEKHVKDIELMTAFASSAIEENFQTLLTRLEDPLDFSAIRLLLFALDGAIDQRKTHFVHEAMQRLRTLDLPYDALLRLNIRTIWAYLQEKNWDRAGESLYTYPLELLTTGRPPYISFMAAGCRQPREKRWQLFTLAVFFMPPTLALGTWPVIISQMIYNKEIGSAKPFCGKNVNFTASFLFITIARVQKIKATFLMINSNNNILLRQNCKPRIICGNLHLRKNY